MSDFTLRIDNGKTYNAEIEGDIYGQVFFSPFPGYCGGGVVHNAWAARGSDEQKLEALNFLFDAIEIRAKSWGQCELFYILAYRFGRIYETDPIVKTLLESRGWEIVHRGETTKYEPPAETVYYKKQLVVPQAQRRQL